MYTVSLDYAELNFADIILYGENLTINFWRICESLGLLTCEI